MKQTATLLVEVAGRKAGSTATVASEGDRTIVLEDGNGQFVAGRQSVSIAAPAPVGPSGDPVVHQDYVKAGGTFVLGGPADEARVWGEEWGKNIEKARGLVELQGVDGTWNHDPYMLGMYNGMLVILATIEGRAKPEFREAPAEWLKDQRPPAPPVERLQVDEATEKAARLMYDHYNELVGGVAWNGDKLPTADEFFEDPAKQKQANAWRGLADGTVSILHAAGILTDGPPEEANTDTIGVNEREAAREEARQAAEDARTVEAMPEPTSEPQPGSAGETLPDDPEDSPPNNGVDSGGEEE